jgi:hypothetical protein
VRVSSASFLQALNLGSAIRAPPTQASDCCSDTAAATITGLRSAMIACRSDAADDQAIEGRAAQGSDESGSVVEKRPLREMRTAADAMTQMV